VTIEGDSRPRPADVVGSSPDNDIAILQIRDARDLPTVDLGRSADLQVGDDVVAIGNALALEGGPTVTRGIVSALNRGLPETNLTNLIQTDAAINAGNSGGPLVNSRGEVVGINTAVIQNSGGREVQNIGFAISIDAARPIIEQVGSGDAPVGSRAFLGVVTQGDSGAVVVNVQPDSPADEAGLRPGDVITRIDGQDVSSAADLVSKVRAHKAGDKVELVWKRGDNEQKATVALTSTQVANDD
jgi:serine protease Do